MLMISIHLLFHWWEVGEATEVPEVRLVTGTSRLLVVAQEWWRQALWGNILVPENRWDWCPASSWGSLTWWGSWPGGRWRGRTGWRWLVHLEAAGVEDVEDWGWWCCCSPPQLSLMDIVQFCSSPICIKLLNKNWNWWITNLLTICL